MIGWMGFVAVGVLNGILPVGLKNAREWKFNHIWASFR